MKRDWHARGLRSLVLTVLALAAGPVLVLAQSDQFVKFQGAPETVAASPLVLAAYAFVWAAVLVYVFLLWQRIGRVERELADVNAKLSARKRS